MSLNVCHGRFALMPLFFYFLTFSWVTVSLLISHKYIIFSHQDQGVNVIIVCEIKEWMNGDNDLFAKNLTSCSKSYPSFSSVSFLTSHSYSYSTLMFLVYHCLQLPLMDLTNEERHVLSLLLRRMSIFRVSNYFTCFLFVVVTIVCIKSSSVSHLLFRFLLFPTTFPNNSFKSGR